MANSFSPNIIFILINVFVIKKSTGTCSDDGDEGLYNCETQNQFKEKVSIFNAQVLEKYLSDCAFINLLYRGPNEYSHYSIFQVPTININFWNNSSEKAITSLKAKNRQQLVRFQEQCKVYTISINGAPQSALENIADLFTNHHLQVQSRQSYIIIPNDSDNPEAAMEFILMPQLKNYPHRIWIETHVSKNETNNLTFEFFIHYFCYYCDEGKPAIRSNQKAYLKSDDVTSFDDIFPDVVKNFQGFRMRVTAPTATPFVHVSPSPTNPDENILEGMQRNILKSIAKSLNFTYRIQRPSGGTGFKLSNGTWTGIMGEVLNNQIDLGISVATTYDRNKMMDFTVSVMYAFLVLVTTKPTPFFEWQAIFYPFNSECWFAVLVSTIIAIVVYRFLQNKSIYLEIPASMKSQSNFTIQEAIRKQKVSTFKSLYLVVGSLLEQGIPFEFFTVPARMFAICWMLFAIIVTCAYRSKLFAFLTFPSIEMLPSNFKELESSHYTWGIKSLGGVALLFITKSPISYVRSIGDSMEIYTDKYSCIDQTFSTRFTCIVYKAEIEYLLETRYWKIRRKVFVSESVTPPIGAAWATPKYSPLLPKLDERKLRIYEMGLADQYINEYQSSVGSKIKSLSQKSNYTGDLSEVNANYKNDEGDGTKPLEMVNLYGGYFILFFGVALGGAVLAMENVRKNKYNKASLLNNFRFHARFRTRLNVLRRNRKVKEKLKFREVVTIGLRPTDVRTLDFSN